MNPVRRAVIAACIAASCGGPFAAGQDAVLPADRQDTLAFVQEHLPFLMEELDELRSGRPDEFERRLRELTEHKLHYREIAKRSPDVAAALLQAHRVEHECYRLAKRIARMPQDDTRREHTAALRRMLDEVFELRLREPEFEIRNLMREIEDIKALIERRKQNQDRIVGRRLQELIEESAGDLEWW